MNSCLPLTDYRIDPSSASPDGEYELFRGVRVRDGARVRVVSPSADAPTVACIGQMEGSFRFRHLLSEAWAMLPLEICWAGVRPSLIVLDPGGALLSELVGHEIELGPLLRMAVSIATALRQMHDAGIIHCDLRPARVMVAVDGARAWVGGFGHALLRPTLEPPQTVAGTLAYLAPEQTGWMNCGIDRRCDLYTLGLVLFELMTGRLPFTTRDANELLHAQVARRAPSAASCAPRIPEAVSAILARLLEKDPRDRYQSAAGVERDLLRCLEEWRATGRVDPFALASADVPLASMAGSTRPGVASGEVPRDVAAFLEVSNALSGELGVEVLVGRILRIVLEHSGGERALLLSPDLRVARARATVSEQGVEVDTVPRPLTALDAPLSVVRSAAQTRELVRIDDASVPDARWPDAYLADTRQRSVFCVPLVNRGHLEGVIYIENRLAAYAFGERRAAFLRLLAAHAASALATATLYADLEGSEARYRFLFDNVPVAIVQIDTRGYQTVFDDLRRRGVDVEDYVRTTPDFVDRFGPFIIGRVANPACARLFGVATTAEVLRPLGVMWYASADTLRRSVLARLAGKKGHAERTQLITLDGRLIDVLFVIAYRERNEGDTPYDIVSMVDLKELVSAERMLERMQSEFAHAARVSMLGELSASLAHEISQPLMAIRANISATQRWLSRGVPDIEEALLAARRINADATRAADVVSRIRDMAVNAAPQRTSCSLNEIIEEATQFLQYDVRSRGVALVLDLSPGLSPVNVDRVQIQQIIVNLAVNAMQAIARGGGGDKRVWIRTLAEGAKLRVRVEDSGPGIVLEDAGRLFEQFFSTRTDGMGMGLRICRSLVEAHEGSIDAVNRPEGGAAFSFTLPVAPASPPG